MSATFQEADSFLKQGRAYQKTPRISITGGAGGKEEEEEEEEEEGEKEEEEIDVAVEVEEEDEEQVDVMGPGLVARRKKPRIVGGGKVDPGRFPYFARLYEPGLCGGTLVASDVVLTAASCL